MAVRLLDYAFSGNLRKVKRCINSGVDVDACESSGNSALYHAVSRNHQECVKYLLSCRADPNRINQEGYTPVNEACLHNNVTCLALLVQYGGSLDKLSADHKESATVSAYKKRSKKVMKFIRLLKDEALTKDGQDLFELEAKQEQKELKIQTTIQSVVLPGLEAVIPQITCEELKSPYIKLFDDMPYMTLQSALWHSTPVTVKRFKELENSRQLLLKEADLLSWLRHPRVSLLMAVCLGPQPQHFCLVVEHFQLASLNHLLYKTQTDMNLPERVHLLLDVAEGMTYLHSHYIVHGFLNSFSVFVYEKFRAKIGNLSFAQEDGEQKLENACSIHENWMAPEQLLHVPPNMAADAYSFGVLIWETLARRLPWSWLTCTIKQAICHHQLTLPMLGIWPGYIQSIMAECFQDPEDRPCFRTLHENLLAIKNRGDGLTSEVLDGAFPDWFDFQRGTLYKEARRRRKRLLHWPQHSSTSRTSEIYLMPRHSSPIGNRGGRSTSMREGLRDILKAFSKITLNSPRKKEIERFGYEIAEGLAVVRNILGVSRNYKRARWAREVVLTRMLEGDIERVIRNEKTATSTTKGKKSNKSSRRGRRYSDFHQEAFERVLVTSSKYQKKNWSKVVHGKEKLKNSMKGYKSKVNEELSECRKKLPTDNSISKEASHDNLAFLSLWENNRETLKSNANVAVKGTLQEPAHSKVHIVSPSLLCDQLLTTRRKSVLQEADAHLSVVRERSDVTSDTTMPDSVEKINGANDGEDGILPRNEYEQKYRFRLKAVHQEIKETFQQSTNSRKDPVKLKGVGQSAKAIYEADLSNSNDGSERLRARSLGPTEPRARSARHIGRDTAHTLSARRGKSDASAVVSDTKGASLENTALTEEDVGNGRLNHLSMRSDMTQGKYISSTPLIKLRFSSNEDWRDVVKRNTAVNGEGASSVLFNDWCHLRN